MRNVVPVHSIDETVNPRLGVVIRRIYALSVERLTAAMELTVNDPDIRRPNRVGPSPLPPRV